jgi:hypothetical protein
LNDCFVTRAFSQENFTYSRTSLNRYSGITSGFSAFFYAIVTENVPDFGIGAQTVVSAAKNKNRGPKESSSGRLIKIKNCIRENAVHFFNVV